MARLGTRSDDRAQLLIVGAIGIAILLTVLALALNTAVYGEVYVAQTDDNLQDERGAIQYRHSVDRAVTGLIGANPGNPPEYDDLESDLRADVDRWNDLTKREHVADDAVTSASITDVTFRSRIVQDETKSFATQSDRSNRSNWTVADDVSAVEAFELRVHDDSLASTDDCTPGGDCFTLEVEGGGGKTWRLFANTTASDAGVAVTVESSDGATTCETTESTASVNVTAGTFDDGAGTECSFTSFLDDDLDPPYTVRYANADNATGTYDLTVGGKIVADTIDADDRYGTSGSPRIEARIETATVAVEYRSPDLTYRTEFRVEGGADDA
ncbi:hypothetical protein [Halopenitus persicus]|uniref:hypothetical protein n=1 Tax=Halopenitus persicus TaxID=1048396 RepID=UPI000BBADF2F|nr:hypothetical protein [Halopenitus persicus]